ncbi:hypothetical protein FRC08_007762 [Ceratobasidium sp. 394]|nr:hypothetical protein FRC08_007762 [Ceratobasidium sp. 394]KAG9083829.1 hypothetical protein FS749_005708 [Ceratobasidium sp. UAMH 11750]
MPKSNSDADENESLTSDEETTSPTRATFAPGPAPRSPQSSRPAMSPVGSHRFSRVQSRRPTIGMREPVRIDPSAKPIDRFRSAVQIVMRMNKTHVALKDLTPGVEPDLQYINPHELYGHLHQDCKVHVWDYGPTRARPLQFNANHSFLHWFESKKESQRGLWSKVRWINISGVSWDILEALKQKYDLHPLSLDVVITGRDNARSKADYYAKHLFIHILSHSLPPDENNPKTGQPLSDDPDPMDTPRPSKTYDPESGLGGVTQSAPYSRVPPARRATTMTMDSMYNEKGLDLARTRTRLGIRPDLNEEEDAAAKASRKKEANVRAIDALKAGAGQIKVDVASIFMFLLRDGTLITIQRDPVREFAQPIYDRLRLRDTLLRSSGDASLLLQSLIDMIVDDAVKVTDKYHRRLLKMERDILLKTKMKTVRDLHIASEDLMLHKRTMGPISQLVYGLRRYDADRAKAVAIEADVGGFLSHQSKVYLADVHDHIEYILSSLDMFSSIAENLINYTFNIVSYETNQVMRGLTIATVIFFPLTFLTGYFGMNFHIMPSVNDHSDALFWEIAAPVMFVVIGLFLWPDIARLFNFLKKRAATKRFDAKKMN